MVFVTGESVGIGTNCGMFSTECNDYATVAYSASSGAKRWLRRWNGPSKRRDTALALAVSPDGSKVFVTGFADQSDQRWGDYATVAYEATTGAQLWGARYNDPDDAQDQPTAIGVSPDGTKVFVTGFTYQGQARFYDYGTIAYDASTGAQLWASRHDGPQGDYDRAFALGISPDGSRVFVTGSDISTATGSDFASLAYDAGSGAELWVNHYDAGIGISNDDEAFALGVSPDGSKVYVTGESSTPSTSYDIATVAISVV
jgi:DNA-binding beta-propeller fold protein YncE